MILPTLWVDVFDKKSSDLYGQPKLVKLGRERVAPVKMIATNAHTTVRTDSSATHGQATELTAQYVVLALPNTRIGLGDVLVIRGQKVLVVQRHERFTVAGKLDHIEIHGDAWV